MIRSAPTAPLHMNLGVAVLTAQDPAMAMILVIKNPVALIMPKLAQNNTTIDTRSVSRAPCTGIVISTDCTTASDRTLTVVNTHVHITCWRP